MIALFDLTDHDSPAGGDPLPDPSSMSIDGDIVTLQLCEVEVRLTLSQCFAFSEAFSSWMFRGLRGEMDLNAENSYPVDELYLLREVVGRMMEGGHVYPNGEPRVSDEVRNALRNIFLVGEIDVDRWKDQQETIRGLQEENVALRGQLDVLKKRRAKGAST